MCSLTLIKYFSRTPSTFSRLITFNPFCGINAKINDTRQLLPSIVNALRIIIESNKALNGHTRCQILHTALYLTMR